MKTVMVFGTFDIVHRGHLSLFQQAKRCGENVVAVVARDERVKMLKKQASLHTEKERKHFLEQIKLIDRVVLGGKKDVYKVIKIYKPDVILLGYDQKFFVGKLKQKIEEFHLRVRVVRAKPYKKEKLKTGNIRKILESKI